MYRRAQHDSKAALVAVRRLVPSLYTAESDGAAHGWLEIVDEYLHVHHRRLVAGPLRPYRTLVVGLGLDVESHATNGIAQLEPPVPVASDDLPPEQQ